MFMVATRRGRLALTVGLAAVVVAGGVVAIASALAGSAPPTTPAEATKPEAGVLDFNVKDIDGKDVELRRYKGQVVLIVNTASQCGLTPQYEGLQKLHEKYADKGLALLAFPSNSFGAQEPGANAEIKAYCKRKYNCSFTLFAKVETKGENICDLYKYLTSTETNPQFAGDIEWNFAKFLIDRQGRVVRRFHPKITPDSKELTDAIEAALAEKVES